MAISIVRSCGFYRLFAAGVSVVMACLVQRVDAQSRVDSLPDESQLPGQQTLQTLPSEAELPATQVAAPRDTRISPRAETVPGANSTDARQIELPGEAVIPTAFQAPQDGPALEDQRHWLRLQSRTHLGRIRSIAFSSDSQRLFVAGDDKQIIVYRRLPENEFRYERTIRWQIQRGQAGRIYAMAATPGMLAIGGYGAMGSLGEILIFDPVNGALDQALIGTDRGHRQRITALAFSRDDDPTLASMDQNGRLLAWRKNRESGRWDPRELAYDANQAVDLQLERTLHPIAVLDADQIVAPVFASRDDQQQARWQLKMYHVNDNADRLISPQGEFHHGLVTAMTATQTGDRLASADAHSQLFLWSLNDDRVERTTHRLEGIVASLAFRRDGQRLLIGTGHAGARSIQLWDISDPRRPQPVFNDPVTADILACAVSPDGEFIAYSQDSDVVLRPQDSSRPAVVLKSATPALTRVAFSKKRPYKLAFSTNKDGRLESVFDPGKGQLEAKSIQAQNWIRHRETVFGWSIMSSKDKTQWWLTENEQRRGTLPLDPRTEGAVTAVGWILQDGEPAAVAIGTAANSNLYVYQLAEAGDCQLLRAFRGHTGRISSIAVSSDRRYLASASADRTIRIWKLEGFDADKSINRWGATFANRDGQVIVESIRDDGPLYFRGLRQGDSIRRLLQIDVVNGQETIKPVEDVSEITRVLSERDHRRLTAFEYQRGRAPVVSFQSFPAWQPVANLYVDHRREWAFWTPAGFYDASFEGHRLFGWQLNRGVNQSPDFVLASQLRKFLERPGIMSRLLGAGSIEAAFRQAKIDAPGNWSKLISQQEQLRPRVSILRPTPDQVVSGNQITVEASVRIDEGQQLVPPKAFANGIVGTSRTLTGTTTSAGHTDYVYRWRVQLPADPSILIQVAASTTNESVGEARVEVTHDNVQRPTRPKLFVVTAGVNQYLDGQVPKLKYAVDNAVGLSQTLERHAQPLYQCRTTSLLDQNVTRTSWDITLEAMADRLEQDAAADDLLVVFLSGHGVKDPQTDQYFYVAANARFQDIQSGRYGDCLSFGDLAAFANVPCRKLVILDTCHSGAIQPPLQRELKAALRALQDDVFLTLTATEGGQEAVESSEQRLGRFTYRLLEALRGAADDGGNGDGIVTLAETIEYVRRTVPADAATGSVFQYPTAGPAELIERTQIPLTQPTSVRSKAVATGVRRITGFADVGAPTAAPDLESTRELNAQFRVE